MTLAWAKHLRESLDALTVYDAPAAEAVARLHANECPEPWPDRVMDELAELIRNVELGRYPDTSGQSLRKVLAEQHDCDANRVVLGNGSDEIISLILIALSDPARRASTVVVPTPTFVMYGHTARVLGLDVLEVPLDADLELDEAGMRAALDQGAAMCFLARPNNPTGSLWSADLIASLVAAYQATVFVIDEAYGAYAPGSSLWQSDGPTNQVHMSTLSKVGLAALRVGYCIAHPELALALNKVRHPYNLSQTSLVLAEAVLTRFADVQAEMVSRTIRNRERLGDLLRRIPGAHIYASAGNLILMRLRSEQAATDLHGRLSARGILIKQLSAVAGLAGGLRVSVGTSAELDLLEDALMRS